MKIAFVALPHSADSIVIPPLPIGYIAALLEQQRHIVRIYDLALHDTTSPADALAPLRAFRPHIAVLASTDPALITATENALAGSNAVIMPLGVDLREAAPGQAVAQALWWIDKRSSDLDKRSSDEDEQSVIFEALLALDDDLDSLPFPARHLLQLEQYPLFTPLGDLQTTVLTGQQFGTDSIIPRSPALIIAEMRSVAREYGIRHFVFAGPLLSTDLIWLNDFLYHLATSDLGTHWEGVVDYTCLTPDLLHMCRRAGCEVLTFAFNAIEVLGAPSARAALRAVVEQAHSSHIAVRALIQLDPTYAAMPTLVDLAATFGLDDVRFNVPRDIKSQERALGDDLENVTEMVQSRYRSSRSRQFFIKRFGPRVGPMLWRVGRAGLLGRTWQRHADGGDEESGMVASGSTA